MADAVADDVSMLSAQRKRIDAILAPIGIAFDELGISTEEMRQNQLPAELLDLLSAKVAWYRHLSFNQPVK